MEGGNSHFRGKIKPLRKTSMGVVKAIFEIVRNKTDIHIRAMVTFNVQKHNMKVLGLL